MFPQYVFHQLRLIALLQDYNPHWLISVLKWRTHRLHEYWTRWSTSSTWTWQREKMQEYSPCLLIGQKIITKNIHLVCSSASQGAEASKVLTMVPCPSPAAQCKTVRPSSSCNWYVADICDCWQQFFIFCGCRQDLLPVFNYNVPKPFFDLSTLSVSQLEVWTLIIQKCTVIPPSSMVLSLTSLTLSVRLAPLSRRIFTTLVCPSWDNCLNA